MAEHPDQSDIRLNSSDSRRSSSAASLNEARSDFSSLAVAHSSSVIDDDTAASVGARNGPSGWGKCTEAVKTLVPSEFKTRLLSHWRGLGYDSEADFVREALMFMVMGREQLEKLHLSRIERLGFNRSSFGPQSGTTEGR